MKNVVVSLFDESGNMVRPWAEAGYQCFCYDLQNAWKKPELFQSGGSITYLARNIALPEFTQEIVDLKPSIIFGFPPCTDLATSGTRHFNAKWLKDRFFQVKAVALARRVEEIGNACGCPWMLENPVSVLATFWRKCNFIFNPYEYGGYLPEDDVHPRYPRFIMPRDAYPKRTCIWSGNGFSQPLKKPVKTNGDYSTQYKKLGGKSAETKRIRSETPRGFAQAVFVRHHGWIVKWAA